VHHSTTCGPDIGSRTAGGLDIGIDVYDQYPGLGIFVGESPPAD
jgi:hypothetical protein